MTRTICCAATLALAVPALAQDQPAAPAGVPDMTKVGPMSRPVTKEDRKGVAALYESMDAAWKKGDLDALADNVDFPVIMLTDDSAGTEKHFDATREQWIEIMKPFATMPKDPKMSHSHRHTAHFLSDTLAVAIEDVAMTVGKKKGKWKSMSVLTFKDGRWKVKQMAEAGWGDMPPPPSAAAPSKTPTTVVPLPK